MIVPFILNAAISYSLYFYCISCTRIQSVWLPDQ